MNSSLTLDRVLQLCLFFAAACHPSSKGANVTAINGTASDNSGVIYFDTQVLHSTYGACTGTKISRNTILTASHCIYELQNAHPLGKTIAIKFWEKRDLPQLATSVPQSLPSNGTRISQTSPSIKVDSSKLRVAQVNAVKAPPELFVHHGGIKLRCPSDVGSECHKTSDIAIIEIQPTTEFDAIPTLTVSQTRVKDGEILQAIGYGCESLKPMRNSFQRRSIDVTSLSVSEVNSAMLSYGKLEYDLRNGAWSKGYIVVPGQTKYDGPESTLCPGDSGGPVLNSRGEIVGVNSRGVTEGSDLLKPFHAFALITRVSEVLPISTWVPRK